MMTTFITISELESFVQSPAFQQAANIPISTRRAISQANNPRAQPDDVALVLIYEKDILLGYLGLVPDYLYVNGQPERICWMSCIWVNPEARGKGIAKQLLHSAHERWEGRLLATEFTAPAKQLYDKLGLI